MFPPKSLSDACNPGLLKDLTIDITFAFTSFVMPWSG